MQFISTTIGEMNAAVIRGARGAKVSTSTFKRPVMLLRHATESNEEYIILLFYLFSPCVQGSQAYCTL